LIVIDSFSRYKWLFPTKSIGSKEAIKHLSYLFQNFNPPVCLVSDRSTAFTSQKFAEFLNGYNIVHRQVAVAAPWANGLVERLNRFLKSSLKKVIEDIKNWSTQLNVIQYVINNTYHSSINTSPSKILFGIEMQNQADTKLIRFLNGIAESELSFQQSRDVARQLETTNKVKKYNKLYYDRKHKKSSQYNPGDYVLIRDSTLKLEESNKLKPRYKGPCMITKILNKNRYVVQNIPGFSHTARPYNSILSTDRINCVNN